MNNQANIKFDTIIETELRKRLKREPSINELKNADTDSDLVNEVLWQMVNDLYDKFEKQEKGIIKLKP